MCNEREKTEEPTLSSVLEFGQCDDDDVLELFNGLKMMSDGFYKLINHGDEWWDAMNQDVWFNEAMKNEWNKVDWDEVETAIEMMSKLMIGTYVRLNKFVDGLNTIEQIGLGYRPQRKKKSDNPYQE